MVERRLRVRPDTFIRMQQHLLEAAAHAHALVPCQILEQRGETPFQAHRHVDTLDRDRRPRVEQVMPEHKVIPVQVPHHVVAYSDTLL
jgi:hypothetical protein